MEKADAKDPSLPFTGHILALEPLRAQRLAHARVVSGRSGVAEANLTDPRFVDTGLASSGKILLSHRSLLVALMMGNRTRRDDTTISSTDD